MEKKPNTHKCISDMKGNHEIILIYELLYLDICNLYGDKFKFRHICVLFLNSVVSVKL
jgi:hypothetical protein